MCPNTCSNGLCDCKGAYCANGGTMNLNTCECTCLSPTFGGKYCENGNFFVIYNIKRKIEGIFSHILLSDMSKRRFAILFSSPV
jgi:hypothetical protein